MSELVPQDVSRNYDDLRAQSVAELAAEGIDAKGVTYVRDMDLRYAGQGYELRVSLAGLADPVGAEDISEMSRRFHVQHAAQHGHCAPDAGVELVSYRLRALAPMPKYRSQRLVVTNPATPQPRGLRALVLGPVETVDATIWRRDDLHPGWSMPGPAIVEQVDATSIVPSGWRVRCDDFGNLLIERIVA